MSCVQATSLADVIALVTDAELTGDVFYVPVTTAMSEEAALISVSAVPEPATLALLGLGGLMIAARRRA